MSLMVPRFLVLLAGLGLVAPVQAMGHRSYVSTGQQDDDIQPVKRGSAANPVAAFAPPVFDTYDHGTSAPPKAAPAPTYNPVAAQTPTPKNDSAAAPDSVPLTDQAAPPPKAVPVAATPSDAGVPALPDFSTDAPLAPAAGALPPSSAAPPTNP